MGTTGRPTDNQPLLAFGALGGSWIGTPDGQRHRPKSRIQAQLFAHLLLAQGEPVSFHTLEAAVWGDRDLSPEAMRNNLRVHMSNLRRWARETIDATAAEHFRTADDSYLIDITPTNFDVVAFEHHVARGQQALVQDDLAEADRHLTTALTMWAEPYPELAQLDRARPERVRLGELYELAVDESLELRIGRGAPSDVIGDLEARTVTHPFRERSYEQLMRALYRVGRQADALATYQRARRVLADELGIEPGERLRSLEASILSQSEPMAPVSAPTRQDGQRLSAGPFVGREAELEVATDAIVEGQKAVVVLGEPGIGKTRLIDELASRPGLSERRWVWARSTRGGPSVMVALQRIADLAATPVNDAQAEYDQNSQLISALAATPGTVLVFDDWQWASEASVRFVRQLLNSQNDDMTVVLTCRDSSADLDSENGKALHQLLRLPKTVRIELGPLSLDAVRDYLAAEDRDVKEAHAVLGRSAGNPLFVQELVGAGLDAAQVPPGAAILIASRLDDATPVVREILSAAAVIGKELRPYRLLRTLQVSGEDLVTALEFGRRTGLTVPENEKFDRFAHDLIRDSLAGMRSARERCEIHDRAATALYLQVERDSADSFELAFHAHQSLPIGSAQRAAQALAEAGQRSADAFAFRDATTYYRQALDSVELVGDTEQARLLPELLAEAGYCTIRGGASEAGRTLLLRALDAARASGNTRIFARAARCITEASSPPGTELEGIVGAVEEALGYLGDDTSEDRVQLLVDLAGLRYFSHPIEKRRDLCLSAIELADSLNDQSRAIAATGTWSAIYQPETADERLTLARTARKAAQRSRSFDFETLGGTMEVATLLELGHGSEADRLLGHYSDRVELLQAPRLRWFVNGWAVLGAIRRGQFDQALEMSLAALMDWENGEHPDGATAYGAQLITTKLLQGEPEAVIDLIEAVLIEDPDSLVYAAALAASQAQANHEAAAETTHELIERMSIRPLRSDALLTPTLAFAAEAIGAISQPDRSLAAELAGRIAPYADHHVVVNVFGSGGLYWGSLRHALGLALAASGDRATGSAMLRLAAEANRLAAAPAFADHSERALRRID